MAASQRGSDARFWLARGLYDQWSRWTSREERSGARRCSHSTSGVPRAGSGRVRLLGGGLGGGVHAPGLSVHASGFRLGALLLGERLLGLRLRLLALLLGATARIRRSRQKIE
jgi:hypothetical protein